MELWRAVVTVLVREPAHYITDRILRVGELVTETAGAIPPNGEEVYRLFCLFTSGVSPCWGCGKHDREILWSEDDRQYLHWNCPPVPTAVPAAV